MQDLIHSIREEADTHYCYNNLFVELVLLDDKRTLSVHEYLAIFDNYIFKQHNVLHSNVNQMVQEIVDQEKDSSDVSVDEDQDKKGEIYWKLS